MTPKKHLKLGFSFLPIPEELMASKAISWGAKHLFGIYGKANAEGIRWTDKYIAKRMGCGEREARRRKKELVDNELIIMTKHPGNIDEIDINFSLIMAIQTPDQTVRGKEARNGPGCPDYSGPGSIHYIAKEHSLKKAFSFLERIKNGEKPFFWDKPMWQRPEDGKLFVIWGKDDFREFMEKESEIEWK